MKRKAFIAVEGADGVGKSTVLRLFVPQYVQQEGFDGFLFFHWKPLRNEIFSNKIPDSPAQNPRGKKPRTPFLSLLFLGYHAMGYFYGYWRYLRPALRQNVFVIADRYSYDILLDPTRFRLNLPRWVLRLFVRLLPRPDAVIALTAPPSVIRKRKPELNEAEINAYQDRLMSEAPILNRIQIEASGNIEDVMSRLMKSIVR